MKARGQTAGADGRQIRLVERGIELNIMITNSIKIFVNWSTCRLLLPTAD